MKFPFTKLNLVLIYLFIFCIRLFFVLQAEMNLREFAGNEVKVRGRVTSEPVVKGTSQSFNLDRVKVISSLYPVWHYSDAIEAVGTLDRRVIGGFYSQFSLIYPDIKAYQPDSKLNFWQGFTQAAIRGRTGVEGVYQRVLPEPESSLLAGIVLGVKRGLPDSFYQHLQKTGTLHLVVASGYNISVVLGTLVGLLAGLLRRQWAILVGFLAVIFYTVMAGGEPAIVRAAIMGSLAYLGQILGRKSESLRLLMVAGGIMLLVNPFYLLDLGFQLSFLATLGIILLADKLPKLIAETTAAQIFVWPLLYLHFGQMNPFAILVTVLIVWLVPYIMGLGAFLALFGWIKPVGIVLGWIAYLPLHLMTTIISWFGTHVALN